MRARTALLGLALAACSSTEPATGVIAKAPITAIRVVNAAGGAVDVSVDGAIALRAVPASAVSARVVVGAGPHVVLLVPTGAAAGASVSVPVTAGHTATVAAVPGASLGAVALTDTGSAPVAGKSKLRVIHLAAHADSIDVWRTQPDFPTPVRVMFPFRYRAESSYIQSTPGDWTVFVTAAGRTAPVLATSGVIPIVGGDVRTVVILDAPAGGLRVTPLD